MDSENANKSKKKKTSNIIQICIGVLAVMLAALIIVMMGIVSSIQGTARVVNYAGLVRGKTQRIIKLEISDQPEDGMIQDIEAFVDGLRNGNGELGLVRLDDGAFQSKMQELDDYFAALHDEILRVREVGYENTEIIDKSERFFEICDEATGLAEAYSQRKASSLTVIEKYITIDIIVLMLLIGYEFIKAVRFAAMNRALQKKVYLDKATGLPNKNKCEELLDDPEPAAENVGVCSFDLNNLRRINNSMGHEAGDAYIRRFAVCLRASMPAEQFVGRDGGDEFIAIIPLNDSRDAEGLFRRFVEGAHELTYKERQFHYTVSLGYALYPDQSTNYKELYRFADMALYAVKVRGGNGCLGYESHMNVVERPQLGFTLKDITDNIPLPLLIMQETEGEPLHLLLASKKALEFFGCPSLESLVQFAGGDMNALISSQDTKRIQLDEENRQHVKIMTRLGAKDTALITRKTHSIYHGDIRYIILIDRNKEIK